jgi:NDP-sugar pyrophosphorylase family protein
MRGIPPVAILAGGMATRLLPVTATVPKILVEVAGQPFIEHQLRLLRREGVSRVVLCVGYLGEQVREAVGNGDRFGLEILYSFDGDTLLGTGGALLRALPLLGERFFVLYGDSYLDVAFTPILETFRSLKALGLMTVYRNEGQWDTSNVLFDGTWVIRYDKRTPSPDMHYIDYGLGLLTPEALTRHCGERACDLADVYAALAREDQLAGYEAPQRFYEIGTPAGLAETDRYLRGI